MRLYHKYWFVANWMGTCMCVLFWFGYTRGMRRIAVTLAVVVALLFSAVLVWTETEQQTISKATAVAEKRGFG